MKDQKLYDLLEEYFRMVEEYGLHSVDNEGKTVTDIYVDKFKEFFNSKSR